MTTPQGAPDTSADHEVRLLTARLNRARTHYLDFAELWASYLEGRPHSIAREVEFDIDLADIEPSEGPEGLYVRPWGSLAHRLQSVHRAVAEYCDDLLKDSLPHAWKLPVSTSSPPATRQADAGCPR